MTTPHQNDQPTDKDSLGVASDTPEFRLLMLAEHLSRGARLRMQDGEFWLFSEDGEGIQGGSIRDAVYGPDFEPTNWQARAEDLEEQLKEMEKDYMCLARPLDGHHATECAMNLHKMIRDLSASQAEVETAKAEVGRLRDALNKIIYGDTTLDEAEATAEEALSPAEKGGEG